MANVNKRLVKEYQRLASDPLPFIIAKPRESNILEWHYVITGVPDSLYTGGEYHGTLIFPSDYPFNPPAIRMITPNGRFEENARICLSISDYHPLTWNPAWSVSTILTGLLSFMLETTHTVGAIVTTDAIKKEMALRSHAANIANLLFKEVFPDLVSPAPSVQPVVITKDLKAVPKEETQQKNVKLPLIPIPTKKLTTTKRVRGVQTAKSEVIEISSDSDHDLTNQPKKKRDTSDDDLQIISHIKK